MKKSSTIYATKGLPGSGKTTWALNKLNEVHAAGGEIQRINNDAIRLMLCGENYRPRIEPQVGAIRRAALRECLVRGDDVIVDNCHLGKKATDEIERMAKEAGAALEWVDFTGVSLDVCIERDARRPAPVGRRVIRKMALDTLGPSRATVPKYQGPAWAPECIIVDIDGTLALHVERGPYDMEKCETDALNEPVAEIVESYSHLTVMLVSGREEIWRRHTESWLRKHNVIYDNLYMRPAGDKRKDDVVKEEFFREHIDGRYRVKFVLDDRNRVVDMWRNIVGLTVLQVADGDF